MSRKIISVILSFCFLFTQTGFAQAAAVELNLAGYFARMGSNLVSIDTFRPIHLRYFSYDTANNTFKVLLDKGDSLKGQSPSGTDPEQNLKAETKELLKYFLIGLTLPNDTFWVNLRPDSEDQIIEDRLALTDVGRIMLETDLQLKKDTAQFTSPQTPEGKEYWDKLYKKAEELYGFQTVEIPTLTRPWIVPGEIIVRETKDSAYIYKATLKVMLEQDYLKDSSTYSFKDSRSKALNEYSSQLIRELIIPKLTKEVNTSKKYANLRQVFYSLILSRWFKLRFQGKQGTYPALINKQDLTNLTSKTTWDKTTYFNAYKKSFAEGEYNIKEPHYTPTGQVIRSYMSGGLALRVINNSGANFLQATGSSALERVLTPVTGNPQGLAVGKLSGSPLTTEQIEEILNGIDVNTVNSPDDIANIEKQLREASLSVLQIVHTSIYNQAVQLDEGSLKLPEAEAAVIYAQRNLLSKLIAEKQRGLPKKSPLTNEDVLKILSAINTDTMNSPDDIAKVRAELSKASLDVLQIVSAGIYNQAVQLDEGSLKLPEAEAAVVYAKRNLLSELIAEKQRGLPKRSPLTEGDVLRILSAINTATMNSPDDIAKVRAELSAADIGVLRSVEGPLYKRYINAGGEIDHGKLTLDDWNALEKQYKLLKDIIEEKGGTAASPVRYASWREFEEKELSKSLNEKERHLSKPLRIAFNIDAFPADENVTLLGSVNRIFDSIIRLMEGNPNFAPVAIFLGDYATGMPGSFERLAEFLHSNPALGNAKYKVRLSGDILYINGRAIQLFNRLAKPNDLKAWQIDFLVETTQQKYLSIRDKAKREDEKDKEESIQASRITSYLAANKDLKVVVIAPDEDKSQYLASIPVIYRTNTNETMNKVEQKVVLAAPDTAMIAMMHKIIEGLVKKENPKATVQVAAVNVPRMSRQGSQDIRITDHNPALAINRITSGNMSKSDFTTGVIMEAAPLEGANTIDVTFRIDRVNVDAGATNNAFAEAAKLGLIDYLAEPTASSRETFNKLPFIFKQVDAGDVKVNRPMGIGFSHQTVKVRGFYSEYGYAKSILDLMTAMSMYEGNVATQEEKAELKAPEGTIPATPERIIPQVVNDGEDIQVGINAAIGRISVNLSRELWFNPNFDVVLINGVREPNPTATFLEYDQVYGLAPFTVEAKGTNFILEDREERQTILWPNNSVSMEKGATKTTSIVTHYGRLIINQDKEKITSIVLHGKAVAGINIVDNNDGTLTANGKLESGTKIRLTYKKDKNEFAEIISAGIAKRKIIPFTNIRQDKEAYETKGLTPEQAEKKIDEFNRRFTREILIAAPQLVGKDIIFLEASGQLTEEIKLAPFVHIGGIGLISAPGRLKVGKELGRKKATDFTIVPGVNTPALLQAKKLMTGSCASCTTNAAATGLWAVLSKLRVTSGFLNTVHAVTKTQAGPFGADVDASKKDIGRGYAGVYNLVWSSTGASTELARAIQEMTGVLSGISLRSGNLDGSLVVFDMQVALPDGEKMPTPEQINAVVKELSQIPEHQGGLKGILGYKVIKSSREVIGEEFGGIFDPSMTKVNNETGTVQLGVWYDNERGYTNQYVILALLLGLYQRKLAERIDVAAQDVVPGQGAYTGRVSVSGAKESNADIVIVGSGQYRNWELDANQRRRAADKKVNVDGKINEALKEALAKDLQPVLNIFISDNEAAEGRVIDAINRQIVEALKDIPAEDAIKLTISLEMENESGLKASDIAGYLGDIRKAVSGYVSRHYEVEMGKEKADILGGNVSKKIRLIVKFNKSNIDPINKITALMKSSDFSGVYLSNKSGVIDVSAVGEAVNNFIKSNPQRAQELRDKYAQRFLFLVGLGSYAEHPLSSYQEALQNLNPYYIQRSIAPVVFQMNELAAMQGGEKPFNWKLPPAQKVPVRVLIQNSAIDNHIEGAADLRYLVEKFSSIQDLMLGHSEQLELTGISDNQLAEIAKEAYALMKEGKMTGNLVMAVGEILTDYQAGRSKKVVEEQTLARIARLNLKDKNLPDRLVIAYEPRWAIGTGLMPTLEEIDSIHATIRNAISRVYGVDTAERVRIIYGGSFSLAKKLDTRKLSPQEEHTRKSDAELILRLRNVDGALIGTASINPEDFARMNSIAQEVYDSKLGKWGIKRKMYMGGNHKAFNISRTYKEFISRNSGIDRRKVEIALAPELSKLNQLVGVYTGDPLEGIVFIDQLKPEEIAGKIFYLRVDFNMPIDDAKAKPNDPSTWIIPDTSRIKATKPDVDFIRQNGGIVVLVTHFEPKGQNLKGPQSVRFMIPVIEETLGIKIKEFVTDVLGREKTRALKRTAPGDVLFLENLRLDPEVAKGEKAKTQAERDAFAKKFYTGVNDANLNAGVVDVTTGFGVAHRPQGSVDGKAPGVPRLGGMLLRDEVLNGIKVMRNAEHPMAIILGGGPKIADKVPMLKNIMLNTMPEGSKIFIYGGASIAFLMAADPSFEAGKSRSLVTEQALAAAREVLELAQELGIEIVLPDDFVVAESLPIDENHIVPMRTVSVSDVSPTEGIYDIGEQALARFRREMLDEEGNPRFMVIFKNGTVGVAEYQQFRNGNTYVDKTIADAGKAGALAGTGGADTRTGLGYSEKEHPGIEEFFDFLSTGGGTFLELLQGKDLPGVESLRGEAGEFQYHQYPATERAFDTIRQLTSEYAAGRVASSAVQVPADTKDAIDKIQMKVSSALKIGDKFDWSDVSELEDYTIKIINKLSGNLVTAEMTIPVGTSLNMIRIDRYNVDLPEHILLAVIGNLNLLKARIQDLHITGPEEDKLLNEFREEFLKCVKTYRSGPVVSGSRTASSAVEAKGPGGIDFKNQAMASATTYETFGSFAGLDFSLPALSASAIAGFDLDKEAGSIDKAIESGIIVSGQRIKEFIAASAAKGELGQRRDNVILWLARLGILEESLCCTQESSKEYREALVIAESYAAI